MKILRFWRQFQSVGLVQKYFSQFSSKIFWLVKFIIFWLVQFKIFQSVQFKNILVGSVQKYFSWFSSKIFQLVQFKNILVGSVQKQFSWFSPKIFQLVQFKNILVCSSKQFQGRQLLNGLAPLYWFVTVQAAARVLAVPPKPIINLYARTNQ